MGGYGPAGHPGLHAVRIGRVVASLHARGRQHHALWRVGDCQIRGGDRRRAFTRRSIDDGCPPRGGILFLEFSRLVLDHSQLLGFRSQQRFQVLDPRLEFFFFVLELVALHRRQPPQLHVQDRRRLDLAQPELVHQVCPGSVHGSAATNGINHFVDVVQRDQETLDDVQPRLAPRKLEPAATLDHLQPVQDKVIQDLFERQDARHHEALFVRLAWDQHQVVHAKSGAQRRTPHQHL